MCKYKQMNGTLLGSLDHTYTGPDPDTVKRNQKAFATMKNAESRETLSYLKEMEKIKTDLDLDDQYCKKFGLLKKASVLAFYGREKDAKH